MARFVVAVKRGCIAVPEDWVEQLRMIEGVRLEGSTPAARRVVVNMATTAVAEVRRRLGHCFHVEEIVRHRLAS
jgi:hypothetical protein